MNSLALLDGIRALARNGSEYTENEVDHRRYGRLARGAPAAWMR